MHAAAEMREEIPENNMPASCTEQGHGLSCQSLSFRRIDFFRNCVKSWLKQAKLVEFHSVCVSVCYWQVVGLYNSPMPCICSRIYSRWILGLKLDYISYTPIILLVSSARTFTSQSMYKTTKERKCRSNGRLSSMIALYRDLSRSFHVWESTSPTDWEPPVRPSSIRNNNKRQ
jgi:hypothetical protein